MSERSHFLLCSLMFSCTQAPLLGARAEVAVGGVKQALSALGNVTVTGATLSVVCVNGKNDSATATSLSDPLIFSPVVACGAADLLLAIQTQNGVTTYLGSADATFSPGDVAVTFSGQLAGEIAFTSATGESFSCSGAGAPFTVPAGGAIVPIVAGNYTLTCTGSSGTSVATPIVVTAGVRTPMSLPASGSGLANLQVSALGFNSTNAITFDPATTSYSLTVELHAQTLRVAVTPAQANAVYTINGDTQPQVTFSGAALDVVVAVTGASTYTVHVTRSALNDDALLSLLGFEQIPNSSLLVPAFSPQTFSYGVIAPAGVGSLQLDAVPDDETAVTTLAGNQASSWPVELPDSDNPFSVHVVAADGFTFNDYALDVPQGAVNPSDTTLQWLSVDKGVLTNPFAPSTQAYSLFLGAKRSIVNVAAIPSQANMPVTVSVIPAGVNNVPLYGTAPLALPNFATTINQIEITVGTANQLTYSIAATRGLIANITGDTSFISGSAFAPDNPRFEISAYELPGTLEATTVDPSVLASISGGVASADASQQIDAPTIGGPLGLAFAYVTASAPGGETDSYWVRIADGFPNATYVAMTFPEQNRVTVTDITNGIWSSGASDTTNGSPHNLTAPRHLAVSPGGNVIYFTANEGIGWDGIVNSSGPTIQAPQGDLALASGNTPGGIAIDPENRFVYVIDGGGITTLIINSDGSLTESEHSGNLGASLIAADALGRFVYAAQGDSVMAYEVQSTGIPAEQPIMSVQSASAISALSVDQSGAFFYYMDQTALTMVPVALDAYGTLAPFATVNGVEPTFAFPVSMSASGDGTVDDQIVVASGAGAAGAMVYTFSGTPGEPPLLNIGTSTYGPFVSETLQPVTASFFDTFGDTLQCWAEDSATLDVSQDESIPNTNDISSLGESNPFDMQIFATSYEGG